MGIQYFEWWVSTTIKSFILEVFNVVSKQSKLIQAYAEFDKQMRKAYVFCRWCNFWQPPAEVTVWKSAWWIDGI